MEKILIVVVAIISVAVAFGRHMPISPDSHENSSDSDHTDDELRKELDELLVEEINSAAKKEKMDNTSKCYY